MHGEINRSDKECVRDSVKLVVEYAERAHSKGFNPTIYINLDDTGMFKIGYAVPFIGKNENYHDDSDWIRRKLVLDSLNNPELNLTVWECKIKGQVKQVDNVDTIRTMVKDMTMGCRVNFDLRF